MNEAALAPPPIACAGCRSDLGPAQLACPACGRLVHAERLRELADAAEQAQQRGDATRAAELWREALERLPPGTRQHEQIHARLVELGRAIDSGAQHTSGAPHTGDAPPRTGGSAGSPPPWESRSSSRPRPSSSCSA